MLIKFKITLLFCFLSFLNLHAQVKTAYPQGCFINPLDIPLALAGNFGELRGNHFHAGFDFRTNGEEGYPVKAVADGYVSRIKVSAYGYGNALYITHNNGYVSVYGHLKQYDSLIAVYIKNKQYEAMSFEVDLFPKKNEFNLKQGQIIGLSGNTGGSEGPHLHFEIRDEKTEEIINPYFFGFNIADTIAPSIEGIAIYPINQNAYINGSNKPKYFDVKKIGKNKYTIAEPINLIGKIGFGIMTFDKENESNNKNGTYAYNLKIDSNIIFKYAINRFAFDQTRYINAHIDYAKFKKSKEKFQRCFLFPGNKIKHYETNENNGIFEFKDTLTHIVTFTASDFQHNTSSIEITCKSSIPKIATAKLSADNYFAFDKHNHFKKEDISIDMPTNCLYDDIEFEYKRTAGSPKLLSSIHHIHNLETPVQNAYTISIKPNAQGLKIKDKLLIVSLDDEGNPSSEGGDYENGLVSTKTRSFGNFAVMCDTIAPTLKYLNFDKAAKVFKQNKIVIKIADNLTGIKSYKGTIDDQWILLEHDNKEKTLTYFFDEHVAKTNGEHIFAITMMDRKGNIKKIMTTFIY
jgi:hypothetical protein